jgi:arylsulfatase A-like enzyme
MKHPNIILISIDTLRADHLSCYGYKRPTTPQLDRIAAEGILFKNAYSTAVWTPPAHASMLTGLYPSQHGTVNFRKLNDKIPTIAQTLRDHGFATAGFVNNPAVGEFVGLDRGFTDFFEIWEGVTSKYLLIRGIHFLYRKWLGLLGVQDHGAKKTNELAKEWLAAHAVDERPFFMFLHYIEPHNPIDAPYPYKKKFVEVNGAAALDMEKIQKVAFNPLVCYTDNLKLNESERAYLISLYDGEIAYVDSMVGEVIESLRAMKILDDTMVIITADHGEHFGEHGHYSHTSSLYQPIVHIPLIIRYPRAYPAAELFEPPVQHVDIFPTLLDLLNIADDSLNNLPGLSLLPRNGRLEIRRDRQILAEWEGKIPTFVKRRLSNSTNASYVEGLFTAKMQMILEAGEKYIYGEDGREELYNLSADPGELNNLASADKARCQYLKKLMMEILKTELPQQESPEGVMDEQVKERLKGLGYL